MTRSSVVRGRRWLAVLAACATLCGSLSLSAAPGSAASAVEVPDSQFQICLDRNLTGKADGESVTAAELATITQLACDNMGIADLTGARYLTNVEDLYLSGNAITSLDGLEFTDDPVSINVSSNKIADLSPLQELAGTTVYADGQTWERAVEVGNVTTISIKGRSGKTVTALSPTDTWPSLTVEGAQVTATAAGLYDLAFADPDECLSESCAYSFNGTVTVRATARFTATPAPTISGTAAFGATLTVVVPDWTPRQLDWAYQWFRNDDEIAGAVASTYKVTADDTGASLRVAVTGILDGYASPSVTSPSSLVARAVFAATPVPTISGTAAIGATLTAHVSGW
ncbi:MAG TPA: hypothetical protein VGK53_24535, partial [Propionicimonas sp.]